MAKQVDAQKLSNLSMVAGEEKNITYVIDNGVLKHWVGIGWIDVRRATTEDFKLYQEVKR